MVVVGEERRGEERRGEERRRDVVFSRTFRCHRNKIEREEAQRQKASIALDGTPFRFAGGSIKVLVLVLVHAASDRRRYITFHVVFFFVLFGELSRSPSPFLQL
jgi:hypothetical protein